MGRPLELSDAEVRVLACLVEKQHTTPDGYPLTLNSLRLACNQATNRDPVLELDEATVREAAQRLGRRGLARFTSGHGSRAAKYRHILPEALSLAPDETALVCLLMLRGAQTPGELNGRSGRLHRFGSPAEVEETLTRLAERELVERLERRPGEKGHRWRHLLGVDAEDGAGPATAPGRAPASAPVPASASAPAPEPGTPAAAPGETLEDRVAALERRLAELERQLGA